MECRNCDYLKRIGNDFNETICDITHRLNTISCPFPSDENVKDMEICYNCKHWIGGGDRGLSCRKHYYKCSTNGFGSACEDFERKE